MNPNSSDTWTFVYVSDMHVGSPRSFRFQPAWNDNWETARRQIVELKPDLLLVGGDMTRDGSTHREELVSIRDDLRSLPFPVHVIPGNHEVGNKYSSKSNVAINTAYLDLYESVFGASEWSFDHRGVRFSGLNSFLLGSSLPREKALRAWLHDKSKLSNISSHVWIIHPSLFIDDIEEPDFDPSIDRNAWYFGHDRRERDYLLKIFRETGTSHVITGHIHCRRDVRAQGIEFHFAPSTAFPQWADRWPDGDSTLGFLRYTVAPNAITKEFVPLERISTQTGYGPGGNPAIEGRDYSVAWEQPPIEPV